MAKGKKASGKNYVSKGERRNVAKSTLRAMRAAAGSAQKIINQQEAWLKGQNPWVTVENPNREETNKRMIRVKANDIWGNPKDRQKRMFRIQGE